MAECVNVLDVRQRNITKTLTLCKLERKVNEFQGSDRLRAHLVDFLSQEINYSHLNQVNRNVVVSVYNNLKNCTYAQISYSTMDFSDPQLAGFLETLCSF